MSPPIGSAVPNKNPTIAAPYRIAVIMECPSKDDVEMRQPLSGTGGRMLTNMLSKCNVLRDACFLGYVFNHQLPYPAIRFLRFTDPAVVSSLATLKAQLDAFQPNVCLLLGGVSLQAAQDSRDIGSWRGSFFIGTKEPFLGRKCIGTFHPNECFSAYEKTPLLQFDVAKAVSEGTTKDLVLPKRDLIIPASFEDLINQMDNVLRDKPTIAIDIEGYVDAMSCISIATSPTHCFIVPFARRDGSSYWQDEEQEVQVWKRLAAILGSHEIGKILQNSLYDRFVLQYSYGLIIHNVIDDTMLKHWELYCELEKGLGFQASIHTKEPYYKGDRKTDDQTTFFTYCCKDSAITYEISNKLTAYLDADMQRHYGFNISMLNPLLYMELRGIKYDTTLAKKRLVEVQDYLYQFQYRLDVLSKCGFDFTKDRASLLADIKSICCYKRDANTPKKEYADDYYTIEDRLKNPAPLSDADKGYINSVCGMGMNTKSPMFKTLLYETLKLPEQYKKDPITKVERLSTDYEALLKIQKKSPHDAVVLALEIGELRTRTQMLGIHADKDGRIRCGYNIVGTETGRLTCYTSPTGSGYNLQTIPSESSLKPLEHPLHNGMRDLFIADPGYHMFQCDLSGADGWTVAAHCASLGDSTMFDDYKAGIKPAKVLCYLLRHGASSLVGKTRQEIYLLTKVISGKDWDYFACKIGQHGTCYLMGPRLLSNMIFIQSEGKVSMSQGDCEDLQRLFFIRYNVKIWHSWMQRNLSQCLSDPKRKHPYVTSASGFRRRFFGRYNEILGQALAHEPQANTTYATNLAAWRLWTDNENRISQEINDGRTMSNTLLGTERNDMVRCMSRSIRTALRIEPLHQVHDALVGQFKIEDTDWAVGKIKSYFNNEIVIAGIPLVIPFEGNYGSSWGNMKHAI